MSAKTNRGGRPPKKKSTKRVADRRTPEAGFPDDFKRMFPNDMFGVKVSKKKSDVQLDQFSLSIDQWCMVAKRFGHLQLAILDPMNEDPELAGLLMPAMVKDFPAISEKAMGEINRLFIEILGATADSAESIFKRILKLMRNRENRDRRSYALMAYHHYFTDHGKEPSKPQLKTYINENRRTFNDMPLVGDGKGWTRLWEEAGLYGMAGR